MSETQSQILLSLSRKLCLTLTHKHLTWSLVVNMVHLVIVYMDHTNARNYGGYSRKLMSYLLHSTIVGGRKEFEDRKSF